MALGTAVLSPDGTGYPGSFYPSAGTFPGLPAVLANSTATAVLVASAGTATLTGGTAGTAAVSESYALAELQLI